VLFTASLHAQTTTNRWTGSTGDWTNTANWSAGAAPVPTDLVFITNVSGSYTVTIDAGTTASTLTNFNLTVGNNLSPGTTTQTLSIVNAPIPLVIQSSLTNLRRGIILADGSSIVVATNFLQSGQLQMAGSGWSLSVANSLSTGGGLSIGSSGGAVASFSGGSVIVTNANNTATLILGNNSIGAGNLFVTNTLLRVSSYSQGTGRAYIDNSGLAATNLLRNVTVSVLGDTAASLTLFGGIYDGTIGSVALGSGSSGSSVTSTITNRGAVWLMTNGAFNIGSTAGTRGFFVLNGGTNRTSRGASADTGEMRIGSTLGGTGTLTVVSGLLTADGDSSLSANGAIAVGAVNGSVGTLNIFGGRVVVTNSAALGNNATVRMGVRGQGFFNMTNGTMLADRFVLGTNAQSFVVGKDALIEIKQAVAFSNVAPLSLTNNFAFDGTLKFSPATATMTQQFQLAGLDLGASFNGYSNNFAIGTLDLSSFGAGNRLRVVSPFNLPSTGLYVHAISAIATNQLISSFNIYYEDVLNPALNSETYALTGGGSLIPIITIPEPSALLFACAGLWALFLRRRSR
jgi:hypothetical protein